MIHLKKTNSDDNDFKVLVGGLDAYLAITDGAEHDFYNQYNKLTDIKHVVLAYKGDMAVACGAIKAFDSESMEVKRMFTKEAFRGQGIAKQVLEALELWTAELTYKYCVLEAGKRQKEAISFYANFGYETIDNYGQYIGMHNSQCFRKEI